MKKLVSMFLCLSVLCTSLAIPALASGEENDPLDANILAFENFDDVSGWTYDSVANKLTKGSVSVGCSLVSGVKPADVKIENGKANFNYITGNQFVSSISYKFPSKKTSGRYIIEYSGTLANPSKFTLRPNFEYNARPAVTSSTSDVSQMLAMDDKASNVYSNGLSAVTATAKSAYATGSAGTTEAVLAISSYYTSSSFDHFAVIDATGTLDYEIRDITATGAVLKTNMPIFLDTDKSSVTVDGTNTATITKRANTTCLYDVVFESALADGSHTISASLTNVFNDAAVVKNESIVYETPFVEGENILAFENFDDASGWTYDSAANKLTKGSVSVGCSLVSGVKPADVKIENGKANFNYITGNQFVSSISYKFPSKKTSGRYIIEYSGTLANPSKFTLRPNFEYNARPAVTSSTSDVSQMLAMDDKASNVYSNGLSAVTATAKSAYATGSAGTTEAVLAISSYYTSSSFDHFAVIDATGALDYDITDITRTGAVLKTNMPIFLDTDKSSVTVGGTTGVITKRANTTCVYDITFANTLPAGNHTLTASLTNVFNDTAVRKTRNVSLVSNEWTEPDYIYHSDFETDPIASQELTADVYFSGGYAASTQNGVFNPQQGVVEYGVDNGKLGFRNIAPSGDGNLWLRKEFSQPLSQKKIVLEFDGRAGTYGNNYIVINFSDRYNKFTTGDGTKEYSGRTTAVIDRTAQKVSVYEDDVLKNEKEFSADINNLGIGSLIAWRKHPIFDKLSIVGADQAFALKFDQVTTSGAVLKTNIPMFVSEAEIKVDGKAAVIKKIEGVTNAYQVTWAEKLAVGEEKTAVIKAKSYTGDTYENLSIKVTPLNDDDISFTTTLPVENGDGICGFDQMTATQVLGTVSVPASATVKMYAADGTEVAGNAMAKEGMYIRVTAQNGNTKDYVLAFASVRLDDVYYTKDETSATTHVYGKAYKDMPAYMLVVAQYDGNELLNAGLGTFRNDDGVFTGEATVDLKPAENSVIKSFIFNRDTLEPLQTNQEWNGALDGVKIITIGDSITGMSNQTYPSYLASLGAEVTNVGVSSTDMAWDTNVCASGVADVLAKKKTSADISTNYTGSQINEERFAAMDSADITKTDVVTILYGTNDWAGNVDIANPRNPKDITTVTGGLRYAIETLTAANPNIKIVAIAPFYRNVWDGVPNHCADVTENRIGYKIADYGKAIGKVAEEYSNVYFFDAYAESGINRYNADHYLSDGLHPNGAGHAALANKIYAFIRDYVMTK